MKKPIHISLILSLSLILLLAPSASGPGRTDPADVPIGQTATLLPDGCWLLIGGDGSDGPVATAAIWDPHTGATTPMSSELQHPRAWHTATPLPDGTMLILGGADADGQVVDTSERFDPATQTFETLPASGLTPRAYHTATLLTEGLVLIVEGVSEDGETMATAELWNPWTQTTQTLPARLKAARHSHSATLLPNGAVLFWGGLNKDGIVLSNGELYDPQSQRFTSVQAFPPPSDASNTAPPHLAASLPEDGAVAVPVDSLIALRFSKPLGVETVNTYTVMLFGREGIVAAEVIPAEGGMLAFITPRAPLLPDATYSLSLNGLMDEAGLLLPVTQVSFTTEPPPGYQPRSDQQAGAPEPLHQAQEQSPLERSPSEPDVAAASEPTLDDEDWLPNTQNLKDGWRIGRPDSSWQSLPPLQAEPGVTALAGQVLTLTGQPLANVTLHIEDQTAQTDETGRFLLTSTMSGWCELLIDGRTASSRRKTYGVFEVGMEIQGGQTNILPYTLWMPKIDTFHAVAIPSPTTAEVVITTPRIPGLEVRIPAGTVIRDHEGHVARQISITPIPVDRRFLWRRM